MATATARHENILSAPPLRRTADALLSRTQQRVMGLLFAEPERSFFATEVIQRADCGSGTVQRELARLCDCGLVQMHLQGKQKHYRANANAPAFAPLQQLLHILESPWLPLQEVLANLPGELLFVRIHVSAAKEKNTTPHWKLLLVARYLKLAQVFAALKPVETRLDVHIEPVLFTPDEFGHLQQRNAPQLHTLLGDDAHTLFGSLNAVTQSV